MRLRSLTLMLALCLSPGCQDDPGETVGVDDTDDEPGNTADGADGQEMLPEDADLELAIEGGEYVGYTHCPDQGLVYVNVALTAPPETNIEQIFLRSVDVQDTLTLVELDEDPGGIPEESGSYVDAGSRKALLFSAVFDDLPAICGDSEESLGMAEVSVVLEVHGSTFEVSGMIDRECFPPSPHICGS